MESASAINGRRRVAETAFKDYEYLFSIGQQRGTFNFTASYCIRRGDAL